MEGVAFQEKNNGFKNTYKNHQESSTLHNKITNTLWVIKIFYQFLIKKIENDFMTKEQ